MKTEPNSKLEIKIKHKKSSFDSMEISSVNSKKQNYPNNINSNKNLNIGEKYLKTSSNIKKNNNKSKSKIKLKFRTNKKNNFNNVFSTKIMKTVSNEETSNYLQMKKQLPIKIKENHNLQILNDEDIPKNNIKYTPPSSNFIRHFRDLFSNKTMKSKLNFSKTKNNFRKNNEKHLFTISNNNNLQYLKELFQLDNEDFNNKKNNEKIFYASDGFKQKLFPKIKSPESKNARSRNYSLCLKKSMAQKNLLKQNIVFNSNLELNNHLIRQFNFSNDEIHSLRNLKTSENSLNKIKETRNKQIHFSEETTKRKNIKIIYKDKDVKKALNNYYKKKKMTKIKNENEIFDGIKEIGNGYTAKDKGDKFSLVKFNELYKVIQIHQLKKNHNNLNNSISKNISKFFEDQTKKLYSTRNLKIPLKCLKRHLRQNTVNKYLRISGNFFGLPC